MERAEAISRTKNDRNNIRFVKKKYLNLSSFIQSVLVDIGAHRAWVPLVIKLASPRFAPVETRLNSPIFPT